MSIRTASPQTKEGLIITTTRISLLKLELKSPLKHPRSDFLIRSDAKNSELSPSDIFYIPTGRSMTALKSPHISVQNILNKSSKTNKDYRICSTSGKSLLNKNCIKKNEDNKICLTPPTSDDSKTNSLDDKAKPIFIKKRSDKRRIQNEVNIFADKDVNTSNGIFNIQKPNYFRLEIGQEPDSRLVPMMVQGVKSLKALHKDKFCEQPAFYDVTQFSPSKCTKPVLVLDLDETLVHCCNYDADGSQYHRTVSYQSQRNGNTIRARMNFRPHAENFLKKASAHYELVVYTASEADYANAVCLELDPDQKYIKKVFSRSHCLKTEKGFVVKDLRVVSGLDTSNTILVDNSAHCFAPQIKNGIPILPFTYEKEDTELLKLLDFLMYLKNQENKPKFLNSHFKLSSIINCISKQEILLTFTNMA